MPLTFHHQRHNFYLITYLPPHHPLTSLTLNSPNSSTGNTSFSGTSAIDKSVWIASNVKFLKSISVTLYIFESVTDKYFIFVSLIACVLLMNYFLYDHIKQGIYQIPHITFNWFKHCIASTLPPLSGCMYFTSVW